VHKFGNDVVPEIKGNQIQKIQVHGKIRKWHERDFIHPSVLKVQLGSGEMMNKGVFAYRGYAQKDKDGNDQNRQNAREKDLDI